MLTRIAFIILLLPSLMACSELGDYLKKPTEPEATEEVVPLPPEEARQYLADLDIQYSQKAFIESAREGNFEAVRLFVWAGMDVNVQPYTARTVLVSTRGRPTTLNHLIRSWFPEEESEDNDTALMKAAGAGHLEIVEFLMDNGSDPNIDNQQDQNAIEFAAAYGHLHIIKLIYDHCINNDECKYTGLDDPVGMSYDAMNHGPRTAIHWAALNGHLDVVEFLYPLLRKSYGYSFPETGFVWGAIGGHVRIINYFINNVEHKRLSGGYALFVASYYGNSRVVDRLLEAGASVHWRTFNWIGINTPEGVLYFKDIGFGPIHAAIQAGHGNILRKLLENWMNKFGADGRDDYGMTALHYAAAGGDLDMSNVLLDNGCPVDPKSDIGMTPLMFAAEWGHVDIVRMLLDLGADASAVSSYGETALSLAQEMGHADIVEMLQ